MPHYIRIIDLTNYAHDLLLDVISFKFTVIDTEGSSRCGQSPEILGDPIDGQPFPREIAGECESHRHRRVQMAA